MDIIKVKELYNEGLTQKQIAERHNTTIKRVCLFMKRHNIQARSGKEAQTTTIQLMASQIEDIHRLYDLGTNRYDIADQLGLTTHGVRKFIEGNCRGRSETLKLQHKNDTVSLTHDQEQFIFGSLLGDASLSYRKERDCYDFQVGHCLDQKEYLEHKATMLNTNVYSFVKNDNSFSPGKVFYKTGYGNKYELERIYSIIVREGKKSPNDEWLAKLEPAAIAYWFMDDGSSSYEDGIGVSADIATHSFTLPETKILTHRLGEFGIVATINKASCLYNGVIHRYTKVSIKQKSINTLMDLIEPTVIKIPCMMYKLKRRST